MDLLHLSEIRTIRMASWQGAEDGVIGFGVFSISIPPSFGISYDTMTKNSDCIVLVRKGTVMKQRD